LEERRVALNNEVLGLERRRDELAAAVEGFAAREASLAQDLENRRAQREADIKKSVEDLSAGMIGDLERRLAARTAEFEAGLADRERQAREALDASLGARRAQLRSAVTPPATRPAPHPGHAKEAEELQHKERAPTASLEDLSSREASAVQTVARLSRRILEEAPTPRRGPASAAGS